MSSMNEYTINRTRETSLEWMTIVEGLIGDYYQQTDPVDDIDRIYRQEEAQEWLDLLEAYGRGEVEYNTLINWQPDFLRDIDGFNDYLADVRFQATWERNANYNIAYCEENGCRDEAMQRFYDKWTASGSPDSKDGMWSDEQFDEWLAEQPEDPVGPIDPGPEPPQTLDEMLSELAEEQQVDRDVVDGVVDMIETIKGSIPTDLESASDLIKGVLSSTVLGSALEECESWTGNTTTEGGMGVPSWTKCVDVGIFGIPGLDLPLPPGMVDISTSVYDIIQKGEDIGESFEDFLEDPSGWLENVVDKAVEKVQDVWGDLQAGVDPKTIGGLSGILNDWIGNILGGYILGQVKDATSAIDPFLYAGDCLDPTFKEANKEYCEDALNQGTLVDCSTFGKTGDLVTSVDQCGPCENPDFTPTGANGECVDPAPQGYCEDGTTPKDNPQGTNCDEYEVPISEEEQLCNQQGRVYNEVTGECEDTCEDPNEVVGLDGSCGAPEVVECNAETATEQVNLTETVPFGSTVPDPLTSYEDDGTQCVATTTTYVEGENPNPPVDCTTLNEGNYQECEGTKCDDGTYAKKGETCGSTVDPLECAEITPENAEACGKQLCNGTYIDIDLPCVPVVPPPPEGCEDPTEADFGKGAGCEKPCPDNADIGISDALCGDTTVTTCLDDTATNFNEEGPCVYGPIEETCENGATDYPECTQCADGSLPDANLGCGGGSETCDNGATDWPLCSECPDGTPTDPDTPCSGPDCSDPDYAAANPEECTPGPECIDCTCAEYAAANPEECLPSPPPPPEGGGSGGSGGQGKREPIEFGISADPELLARKQFPITDYLSGLFTGNR